LDPQNPYFHNNLGETYVLQGNLAGAQREFLRRIQLHPDDAFAALTSLGVILIHEGRVDEGRRQLLAALRIYSQRAPRQDVMTADDYFMNRALAGLGDPDSGAVWQEAISRRQIPTEDLADWKRYIDLLKAAPQPPTPVASIAELLEVAGTTRPAR
jgi:tetratricopeptide (TPR) repeat protein